MSSPSSSTTPPGQDLQGAADSETPVARTPRLRIHLKPAAEEAVRAGHPWVFDQSIQKQNRPGEPGELAALYDRKNRFLALGLFDPDSPLRVRVLHVGKPVPVQPDWWRQRLHLALQRRQGRFDSDTTGHRWIHGESDGWPGLVLDRYSDVLVLKLYTAAWLPWLDMIVSLIREALQPRSLVLRLSRNLQPLAHQRRGLSDGQVLYGPPVDRPVLFREHGLWFEADVCRGQKTGFFLDQRDNRQRVRALAAGRHMLNLFSFSGAFSVAAAAGGACAATDLDLSSPALEAARRHFALNASHPGVRRCHHQTIQADAFEWLRQAHGAKFDLIVVDPPALARQAADVQNALRAYRQLVRASIHLLRPGGILVAASCTAHVRPETFFGLVREVAAQSGRRWKELGTTRQPDDHPASFPEAEYLKCIYLEVTGPVRRRGRAP
ncbi:class I SAM-dependent methyltransferase [Limisphaera sp. VF-2]|jgi:23S rRNA (cytosine1962-C5)-methyltransferase|uniref:class I SAM-dependent methyltransferase n=1 Tax=Limisphaera sp. VF-2 TaxID=3400418 RepID=UPI001758985C